MNYLSVIASFDKKKQSKSFGTLFCGISEAIVREHFAAFANEIYMCRNR
jgi:hypothetical protein